MVLHPISYFSKKMSPAERNYGIGNKELLAIVYCFEEWHLYLERSRYAVQVFTDHLNLQQFITKIALNQRQIRSSLLLANYNFKIQFRQVKSNTKANPFTRRSGDLLKGGSKIFNFLLGPYQFQ